MKRFALALLLCPAAVDAIAAEEGFDRQSCAEIRGAVELFLALADTKFKDAERTRERGDATTADARFGEAVVLSGLAADYSTIYATFCKD